MEFHILGPLEVLDEGEPIALGGSKQRALLALLLVHAGETLGTDRLIDDLWGERPPATAAKTLQVHVSRLRKVLAAGGRPDPVATREHGYQLRVEPERIDAHRFERLLADGRAQLAAEDPATAARTLEEALSLWRGAALADLAYEPFAQREGARLEEARVSAHEELVEAKLAQGRHAEVVGELEVLIAENPYRERLRAQLMLALYRSERQADALQAFQNARVALVEELGIEPGERLRELERAILTQDSSLAVSAPEPPAPADAPPGALPTDLAAPAPPGSSADEPRHATRRLVSIVFADLAGSTGLGERLDPESMHVLLDRFMETCGAVIERHGGSVEGFIGDAVVGVFGQRQLHEDDALRAVRVAVEMRAAGAELSDELERDIGVGIGMKFGVESGEVFVSTGARRSRFAAGDAFNVAARLEGLADVGEILIGERAHALLGDTVTAEPLGALEVKGRAAPVGAWRLVEVLDGRTPPGRTVHPFVDRGQELGALRAAFDRAATERTCHLVTLVGPAGIGKSRLARELADRLGEDATVAVGRCQSYGEGVTYRPLAEIVEQLGGAARVKELLGEDHQAARLVLATVGLAEGTAQPEETSWAIRSLFERVASERPFVVGLEDVHWAEPTLFDLVEYLGVFSRGQPILIVTLARPDFLEMRPAWVAPHPNRTLVTLEALPPDDARVLVEAAGAEGLASTTAGRIVDLAEGNPLFLEQLVAVGVETGEAPLPTTIQAVLAARIDRLTEGERAVLELASVQGRSFYVGALAELLPDLGAPAIEGHVVSLVNKQLIGADRSDHPGEDAFRFAHALIREVAYAGLPKQVRADLHERMARWLESRPRSADEAIGRHLGEAYRLRAALGPVGERERALASAAAERLGAAASAALVRGDSPAGARLLEQAVGLLEEDPSGRAELLPALGAALHDAGRLDDAARVLDEAIADASEPRQRARAQVERELVRFETDPSAASGRSAGAADAALSVLEREGDEEGQSRVWLLRGQLAWNAGRVADADAALRNASEHASAADDEQDVFEVIGWRALVGPLGPTPVDEAIERCEAFRELARPSPLATASTLNPLALLHAMRGELDAAERLLDEASTILAELGGLLGSGVSHLEAWVRLLTGEPALAEAALRPDVETLEAMSAGGALATTTALLAQAVYAQGRLEEAEELCRATAEVAAADDVLTQMIERGVLAKVLARRGEREVALELAHETVALGERTDLLSHRGDAMLDLADVLRVCGRDDEADLAIRKGFAEYELKGNTVAAARARSLLDHH